MKRTLEKLSIEDLARLFVRLAIANDDALLGFETRKSKKILSQLWAVVAELKSRPGDQRTALLSLYGHGNPEVRLQAADATLAIAPVAARQILESMKDIHGPQRLHAGMKIYFLDRGIYKPT